MLSSTFTIDELGSGRIRLPPDFVQVNSIAYAQPVVVTYEKIGKPLAAVAVADKAVQQHKGGHRRFLLCRRASRIPVHCISSRAQRALQWHV